MTISTTNPATGETLKTFSEDSDALVEEKLAKAAKAFLSWRRTSFADRARRMLRAAVGGWFFLAFYHGFAMDEHSA